MKTSWWLCCEQVDTAELGAIVKIRVKDSMKQHRRLWSVEEVSLKDVDTKEELRFSCRAHVGHKLISDERIFQHLRDPENTANVEHNEVEVFALRHDRPVLPSESLVKCASAWRHCASVPIHCLFKSRQKHPKQCLPRLV